MLMERVMHSKIAVLTVVAGLAFSNSCWAVEELANPISAYELTLMPPTKNESNAFGWIRLLNGTKDAGYIYLESSAPQDPHLSFNKDYIVTGMPLASLDTLLSILRGEKNLQIRYFDHQSGGGSPSVFIEPRTAAESATVGFKLDKQALEEMRKRRGK